MRPVQARVITLCQQTLALGVVLAVMTPAAGVVSLDIVGGGSSGQPQVAAAPGTAALSSATVATEAVEAEVTEVPLTAAAAGKTLDGRAVQGRTAATDHVVSTPQPVTGYAAVGVTWDGASEPGGDLTVQVRTRTDEEWSDWQEVEYHDEHGPDPSSVEAAQARPGTEPMFVGEVDEVQVEARTDDGALPADLSLAVIEPGEVETATETPAVVPQGAATTDEQGAQDGVVLQRNTIAQPMIYSRAQWGADESIRNNKSLRYGTINAGFVHHTVNANNYTEAQVPGLMRSIYAYHVKSRGWSDIGYNFLVDRFGRIWEGRYGGVDKPVIGAHTLGYNEYSFAMSAIGNFDVVDAPDVMLRAYGQLFAWKLSLHGVNPASTSQKVGRSTFKAINGHRDAGSTACPGRYLYAKLDTIRSYAVQGTPVVPPPPPAPDPTTPISIGAENPQTNLVGSAHPDLVLRRATDNRAIIVPTGGLTSFAPRKVIGTNGWNKRAQVFASPDLTGDGIPDLVTVTKKRVATVRAGTGTGRFGKTVKRTNFKNFTLLTAVGDINGDGHNDLVGRRKGMLISLTGDGKGGFKRQKQYDGFGNYRQLIGAGDITGDGRPDVLGLTRNRMDIHAGLGGGKFAKSGTLQGNWSSYNMVVGGADFTGDGRPDLLARTRNGQTYLLPLAAPNQLGTPVGPVGNFKTMRFLSTPGQMVGGSGPELVGVVGKRLIVRPNNDTFELGAPIEAGVSFSRMNLLLNAGDVNRDGHNDVVTRHRDGTLWLYAGNGTGQLAKRTALGSGFGGIKDLRAVGDVTGDGLPDLVGTVGGTYTIWPGNGSGFGAPAPVAARLKARAGLPTDLSRFDWVLSVGDMQLKGGPDHIVRERGTGRLLYYNGRAAGVSAPRVLGGEMEAFNLAG